MVGVDVATPVASAAAFIIGLVAGVIMTMRLFRIVLDYIRDHADKEQP